MPQRPQVELLCADRASVLTAGEVGADRVELCAAPEVGGVTPGPGFLAAALGILRVGVEAVVLVRPRAGDFLCRSTAERTALVQDVRAARAAGAHGVAVGVLTRDGGLDRGVLAELVAAAEGLAVTVHRAVDLAADPVAAAVQAAELGARRVLSSGGAPTALEGAATLARMVEAVGAELEVVAASGVRGETAARVLAATGVGGLHGSCAGPALEDGGGALGMGSLRPMDRASAAGLVAAARGTGFGGPAPLH